MVTSYPLSEKVYYAKSSEEKPTENVAEGSAIYEVDTGDVYIFYDGEWIIQ